MTRSKPLTFLAIAAVVPLGALGVAAAGSAATVSTPSHSSSRATVQVRSTSLGKILVDSHGRTLYLFKKDKGTKSACSGACASAWPPLRATGKPTVGSGAKASLVATTKRSDGKPQVTYDGHPLYRFIKDTKPGDTNGQGLSAFGARWYVVSPAGKQITAKAGGGGSSSSSY